MIVTPLAAESLGVRSVATYVECGQTRVLIDPGAILAASRFGPTSLSLTPLSFTKAMASGVPM